MCFQVTAFCVTWYEMLEVPYSLCMCTYKDIFMYARPNVLHVQVENGGCLSRSMCIQG